jgi:hypothetical protein
MTENKDSDSKKLVIRNLGRFFIWQFNGIKRGWNQFNLWARYGFYKFCFTSQSREMRK